MTSILWPVLVIGLGIYLFFKQTAGSESQNFTSEIFPQGKSFYKSKTDKRIAGVCGGIGAYFGIDSNIIRVLWTVATLGSFGFGVLGYLVLAVVLSESD
ncbi:MAG: PspC domain-containing protein [Candidatus Marinimicrobia bacterium]|nr:PspC domain-containing protein [Candidatus Neomarinimicrobiota bacterium]